MSRQLVFDLPHRAGLGREDFLVTEANAAALAAIDAWPAWPAHAMILLGPPGSGKSHLTEIWRERSGAALISARNLSGGGVYALLAGGAAAVEDLEPHSLDERAAFHLLNFARETGGHVLMTARSHPGSWPPRLPDLASRLKALPSVAIATPDDALLRAVLVKLFADRQIAVGEPAISYLLAHMPRSLEAANRLVGAIDTRALEEKAEITRPFVARVLAEHLAPRLFGEA